ncbi:RICIN domain-containing protein [Streptomyces sp. NPDC094472]|uniref:RICIN domain-containing protein n=1 Tax=unclassified Streptomyces TaxID=2593676 RepID=UPI0033165923
MLALRSGRRSRVAGLTAVLVTGVLGIGVANASSAKADAINTFTNHATSKCLEYGYTSSNCDGHPAQQWNVHAWADGTRELKNMFVGKCLDDSNQYGLRTFPCNATPYQSWYVIRHNNNTLSLRNEATGRCLDDSLEYGLRTFSCNGMSYQEWY